MCGIMGYVGDADAWPGVLAGLRRLEYRGYDSAGIATLHRKRLRVARKVGPLSNLEAHHPGGLGGRIGIGHTRWATHGGVTEENCHPHLDPSASVAVVHNGILDNADALRATLEADGATFASETDTEVLSHLIARELAAGADLLEATRRALGQVEGTAGLLVMSRDFPTTLVAARIGSPVVVGLGEQVGWVASDAEALAGRVQQVVVLAEGELAEVGPGTLKVVDRDARPQQLRHEPLTLEPPPRDKGGWSSFYERELREQPASVQRATRGRLDPTLGTARLGGLSELGADLFRLQRVTLFGCGSSLHAAEVGQVLFETLARIPTRAEHAAELRARNPIVTPDTLHIGLSQSGETADTLAALRELRVRGLSVAGITNRVGSSLARETRCGVYLHSGPEVSVASTKTFTSQVAVLTLIALQLARARGLAASEGRALVDGIHALPDLIGTVLDSLAPIADLARDCADARYVMFVGRGLSAPVAREGALKLQELAYVPAQGLSAADAKHGPLAMIAPGTPVWVLAPPDDNRARTLGNARELAARGARLCIIAGESDHEARSLADTFVGLPPHHPALSPCLTVLPLQLFALHMALARGCSVDRPRNLAKSVTVE
jgi:glucosamine--fructose-6-phosphate aminotransferase (isomerizing)